MFHFSPRNALLPSAALAILLGLTACGGGSSDPAPADTPINASGAAAGAAAGTVTTTTPPATTPPTTPPPINITGLTDFRFLANNLVNFAAATPNTAVNVPITGLAPGQTVVGIDVRPATGQMYAFARADNAGAPTGPATIYRLDPTNGAATAPVAVTGVTFDGATSVSVDFNPAVDRLRVITFFGQSTAIDVTTGVATASPAVVGSTTFTAAVAYSNSAVTATAPASTVLYRIDNQGTPDDLSTVVPTTGVATTVGAIGPDLTEVQAFDIGGTTNQNALAALRTGVPNGGNATQHSLYRINLSTGAATLFNSTAAASVIGGTTGAPLVDIAIRP